MLAPPVVEKLDHKLHPSVRSSAPPFVRLPRFQISSPFDRQTVALISRVRTVAWLG